MNDKVYGFRMGSNLGYVGTMYVRINENGNLVFGTVSPDELDLGVTYNKARESRIVRSAVSVVDAFLVAATAMSRNEDVEAVRRNAAMGANIIIRRLRKDGIVED